MRGRPHQHISAGSPRSQYRSRPRIDIGGYALDLAAAVLASQFATDLLARADVIDRAKRDAVRTALLPALKATR